MLDSFLHSRLLSVTSRELSEFRHVVVSLFKLFLLSRPEVLPAVLLKLQVFWDVTRHVSFSDYFPKSQRYIPQDVLLSVFRYFCFSVCCFTSLFSGSTDWEDQRMKTDLSDSTSVRSSPPCRRKRRIFPKRCVVYETYKGK